MTEPSTEEPRPVSHADHQRHQLLPLVSAASSFLPGRAQAVTTCGNRLSAPACLSRITVCPPPPAPTSPTPSSPIPEGRSSCEQHHREQHHRCDNDRARPIVPVASGQPGRSAGSDRAPRGRQLPPGPSGLVHRPRPRRRRVGDRGLHRPAPRHGPVAGPPGRPLHVDHPERRRRHVRADRRAVGGARRVRARPVPGLPEPARGVHRHHHRDRGGLRRRRRPAAGRGPGRDRGRRRPTAVRPSGPRRLAAGQTGRRPARPPGGRCRGDHHPVLRQPARERHGDQDRGRRSRRPGGRVAARLDRRQRRLRHVDGGPDHPGHQRRRPGAGRAVLRVPRRRSRGDRTVQRMGDLREPSRPAGPSGRRPG